MNIIQLDFWADSEIERLEKRIATLHCEIATLKEENEKSFLKRFSKRIRRQYAKMESLPTAHFSIASRNTSSCIGL